MKTQNDSLIHARALQADILAAPDLQLPRREVLLEWLDGFVKRATAPAYEVGGTELDDLNALDQFLRKENIPVAGT